MQFSNLHNLYTLKTKFPRDCFQLTFIKQYFMYFYSRGFLRIKNKIFTCHMCPEYFFYFLYSVLYDIFVFLLLYRSLKVFLFPFHCEIISNLQNSCKNSTKSFYNPSPRFPKFSILHKHSIAINLMKLTFISSLQYVELIQISPVLPAMCFSDPGSLISLVSEMFFSLAQPFMINKLQHCCQLFYEVSLFPTRSFMFLYSHIYVCFSLLFP